MVKRKVYRALSTYEPEKYAEENIDLNAKSLLSGEEIAVALHITYSNYY